MKRTTVWIAALSLLTACAPSRERLQRLAMEDTNDTLCVVQIVKPSYADVARAELARRGASCDWERTRLQAQAWLQQQQASEAASAAYLGTAAQILNNSGPRPAQPYGVNCTSVRNGPFVNTNCQ